MQLVVDTHTHTYASGHAYSTLNENAASAQQNGLKLFCTTDHAESMPGAPHYWFFSNQRVLPRIINGVGVVRGVEANILNVEGEIDLHPSVDRNLDWVIASFHEPVFHPANVSTHTQALINTIKSGRVDALGHLGNPNFDFDFESVIYSAAEHNVAIEINNTTLVGNSRVGSVERCYEIAEVAKRAGAYLTTGSDAHYCSDVGNLSLVNSLLNQVGIPAEQVITSSVQRFTSFLELRGRAKIEAFGAL
ncbi:phosphatase [Vibrio agarivorans]|uniref:Phosphatase n=1 Tax=Vibrio agarivorans TaxID=153622 RepID=A0ABT7Y454_9VIBR|nr:phosphatase [Vibrio agarivorans]MDN2482818.1 phosphatase [Vibrio agarivorans]